MARQVLASRVTGPSAFVLAILVQAGDPEFDGRDPGLWTLGFP
jgi:hypothetical protein